MGTHPDVTRTGALAVVVEEAAMATMAAKVSLDKVIVVVTVPLATGSRLCQYKQTFATQTSKVARERSLTIVKLVQPFIDELSDLTNNVFHVLSVRILLSVFSNFLRDRFNILENV